MITYACLNLIIILASIFFKFYFSEYSLKLNISSLIGDKFNNTLNYYLIKIKQNDVECIYFYYIVYIIGRFKTRLLFYN